MFVDTEPRSATLHQRLDHQPTFARSDALSVLFMQAIYFQLLACSSTQRPRSISFSFNHFRTLFIATEGVPHLPIPHTRRRCTSLSPLDATPMDLPASVAKKRLTPKLSPLDATFTKKAGGCLPAFPFFLLEYAHLPHHHECVFRNADTKIWIIYFNFPAQGS